MYSSCVRFLVRVLIHVFIMFSLVGVRLSSCFPYELKNACADEQAELAIAMVKTWAYKCVETGPGYALEFTSTLVGSCRRELNRADSMVLMQAVPRHPAQLGVLRLRAPPRLHVSFCSSCYPSHKRRCSSSCLTQKKLLTQKKRTQEELTNQEADTKEAVLATGHVSQRRG